MFEADDNGDLGADQIKSTDGVDKLLADNDKTAQDSILSIQKNLTEYNSKRLALETVFKTMTKDESDFAISNGLSGKIWDDKYLDDQLTAKVYSNKRETTSFLRNPYLKNYEAVFKLKRIFDRIEVALEKDRTSLSKLRSQNTTLGDRLANTTNLSVKKEIQSQIDQNTAKINEINKTIASNEKERLLAKERYDTKLSNFKKLMLEEEKKLTK